MIISVFTTGNSPRDQWQAELLEHSWLSAGQPGELIRLVACHEDEPLPEHQWARVIRVMPWNPHPWTGDAFAGYNKAASLMEWLYSEPVDAVLLLLEQDSVVLSSPRGDVRPGSAVANVWPDIPTGGDGPFGLTSPFEAVQAYCVNRKLTLPGVQYPVMIHSSDLKKIAPRWLELTSLLRASIDYGNPWDVERLAYTIAAAEFGIAHDDKALGSDFAAESLGDVVCRYRGRVMSDDQEVVWDSERYEAWTEFRPEDASKGAGRDFLAWLQEYVSKRTSGRHLAWLIPARREGVREARVLDQVVVELPGDQDALSLNASASAIWELIDGQRTITDITMSLQQQFGMPEDSLFQDVNAAMEYLAGQGAIKLLASPARG